MDETFHVSEIAGEVLELARTSRAGRAARSLWGGPSTTMTQTVIGLAEGQEMDEHENPGEATVHVLTGQVQLRSGTASTDGATGDLLIVPPARHSLYAATDAVVLLTAAKVHAH